MSCWICCVGQAEHLAHDLAGLLAVQRRRARRRDADSVEGRRPGLARQVAELGLVHGGEEAAGEQLRVGQQLRYPDHRRRGHARGLQRRHHLAWGERSAVQARTRASRSARRAIRPAGRVEVAVGGEVAGADRRAQPTPIVGVSHTHHAPLVLARARVDAARCVELAAVADRDERAGLDRLAQELGGELPSITSACAMLTWCHGRWRRAAISAASAARRADPGARCGRGRS